MLHRSLGPGGEFDRIRHIAVALGSSAEGLGEDCAIIPDGPGRLVTSIDAAVEGVHFRREWLTLEEIGWRACAGALSDLAAAGATPVGVLAALVVPAGAAGEEPERLMRGIGDAAEAVGAPVRGGDLTRGPVLAACVSVFGRSERVPGRGGACPGDALWVSGTLGGARAALVRWERGEQPDATARQAFARPEPRIAAGRWLAANGATAMLDLSDGLAGDMRHLAAASAVGVRVDLASLPLHTAVAGAARLAGEPPPVFAAQGGEDYELLATLPRGFSGAAAEACLAATGVSLTRVGSVEATQGVRLILADVEVTVGGFDHFA